MLKYLLLSIFTLTRAEEFKLFNKTLTVEKSTVSQNYSDYQFSFYMDQNYTKLYITEEINFYVSLNFTEFFEAAGLWLTHEQILC